MPQVFKIGSYHIYFWSDEGIPLEPVHVHVSEGSPTRDATKIWITKNGKTLLCHNKSKIPNHVLNDIEEVLETRSFEIIAKWQEYFKKISFYC